MKILRFAFAAVLVAVTAFTGFYGKNAITDNGVSVSPAEYKGILTLWHIDTFEGGVGSRKQFLLSVSREFEKKNTGVLVMAIDHTAESAAQAFSDGKIPDLISFGAGVNPKNLRPLELNASATGGGYNGNLYAVPWCRGGYCIIENPEFTSNKNAEPPLLVSQGEYTNPLVAYALSGKGKTETEILSPQSAYVKFVSGKSRYMLGTQRDINRLISRGMDFTTVPLNGYNDLYQYISVTSLSDEKAKLCAEFIKYLISDDVQKQLNKIGMYGCFSGVEYDSPDMSAMQKTEFGCVLSAFSSKELITELQGLGICAAAGDADGIVKIKKLIATP